MATISIARSEEDAARLQARTASLAIAPKALAAAVLHDELNSDEDDFAVAKRIVDKNRELYGRLA